VLSDDSDASVILLGIPGVSAEIRAGNFTVQVMQVSFGGCILNTYYLHLAVVKFFNHNYSSSHVCFLSLRPAKRLAFIARSAIMLRHNHPGYVPYHEPAPWRFGQLSAVFPLPSGASSYFVWITFSHSFFW
jgi:hypothetical protein